MLHILKTNNLHIVIWFQVFLSNTNNLQEMIWLLGLFYIMSALVGLFSTKVILTIMVSNYIGYKNLFSQSF